MGMSSTHGGPHHTGREGRGTQVAFRPPHWPERTYSPFPRGRSVRTELGIYYTNTVSVGDTQHDITLLPTSPKGEKRNGVGVEFRSLAGC